MFTAIKLWLEHRKATGKSNAPIYAGVGGAVFIIPAAVLMAVVMMFMMIAGGTSTTEAGNDNVAQNTASTSMGSVDGENWEDVSDSAEDAGANPYILGAIAWDKTNNDSGGSGAFGLDTGETSDGDDSTAGSDGGVVSDAANVSADDPFMANKGNTHDVKAVYLAVRKQWSQIKTIGGIADRSGTPTPNDDHTTGKAADIMIPNPTSKEGKKLGDTVANYFLSHAKDYGVTYVIWHDQIAVTSGKNNDWRDYNDGPYKDAIANLKHDGLTKAEKSQINTWRHMDHVHVSVYGDKATAPVTPGAQASASGNVSQTSATGKNVTWIGDALASGDNAGVLKKDLAGLSVDATTDRAPADLAGRITALKKSKKLKDTVVAELGAYGTAKQADLDAALKALGKDRQLILVTPHGGQDDAGTTKLYKSAAKKHPEQVQVADWDAATPKVNDFDSSGIVPGRQGLSVLAKTVEEKIVVAKSRLGEDDTPKKEKAKDGKVDPKIAEDNDKARDYVADALAKAQDKYLPDDTPDLGYGYHSTENLSDRKPIKDDDDDADGDPKAMRKQVRDAWISVVEKLPIADAKKRAPAIVDKAIDWVIGKKDPLPKDDSTEATNSSVACTANGDDIFYTNPPSRGGHWEKRDVTKDINKHPDWVKEWKKAGKSAGMDWKWLAAQAYFESGLNPRAGSPAGAQGLTQFMPDTWPSYGHGSVTDPIENIRAQGKYMGEIFKMMKPYAKGDAKLQLKLTFAGYNSGPYLDVYKQGAIPPILETQDYARALTDGKNVKCKDVEGGETKETIKLGNIKPGHWASPLPGSSYAPSLGGGFGPRWGGTWANRTDGMSFHEGIDISGGGSKFFYAPTKMKITAVQQDDPGVGDPRSVERSFGAYIYAKQVGGEGFGFEFHENKPNSLRVKVGDVVEAGTALGEVGMSGTGSKGVHVHFQIDEPGTNMSPGSLNNGHGLDPIPILKKKGVTIHAN